MPGVVRKGKDSHVGHASPSPAPFHGTSYAKGSPNVYVNSASAVRIGDTTACGDPASAGSPNVYVNSIKVHRLGDGTGGHGSWVPNASASSSSNVFANGGGNGGSGTKGPSITKRTWPTDPNNVNYDQALAGKTCDKYNWDSKTCLVAYK